jgi:hypothetical protein
MLGDADDQGQRRRPGVEIPALHLRVAVVAIEVEDVVYGRECLGFCGCRDIAVRGYFT